MRNLQGVEEDKEVVRDACGQLEGQKIVKGKRETALVMKKLKGY